MGNYVNNSGFPQVGSTGSSAAKEIVENRFDLASSYASQSFEIAQTYINNLDDLLKELELVDTSEIDDVVINPISPVDYGSRPDLGDVNVDFEGLEDRPVLDDLNDINEIDVDEIPSENFDYVEQVVSKPSVTYHSAPSSDVNLESVELPDKPSKDFPAAFQTTAITFPDPITIDTILFDVDRPTLDVLQQPTSFSYSAATYSSDIWSALLAKILEDIVNGGTGLNVNVEEAIYQRALSRMYREHEELWERVTNEQSGLGWSLPPGSYAARLRAVQTEISRQRTDQANELMIMQGKLSQENTHFIIGKGVELEGMLREFFDKQEERAIRASAETAKSSADIYRYQIEYYNAKLEGYKSEAAVYAEKLKALQVKAETYKTQMEGSKIEAEVQGIQADVYKTQIEAIELLVRIYEAEMRAAELKSRIELSKVEVLRAKTQVYVAKQEGERLKVAMYAAENEAERTRASILAEKVRAYVAKVQAGQSKVQARLANEELKLKENQLLLNKYVAELQARQADIESELKNAGLVVEGFRAEVQAYTAETGAIQAENLAKIEELRTGIQYSRLQLEKALGKIKAISDSYIAVKSLQERGTEGVMAVGSQLASSAMNSVNANASYGYSGGVSFSESTTHSEGITESHPYEAVA